MSNRLEDAQNGPSELWPGHPTVPHRFTAVLRLAALVTASGTGLTLMALRLTAPALTTACGGAPSAGEILTAVALVAATALAGWLWLLVARESVAALTMVLGDSWRDRATALDRAEPGCQANAAEKSPVPGRRLARRLVALTLGIGVFVASGSGVAQAAAESRVVVTEDLRVAPPGLGSKTEITGGWKPTPPSVRPLPDPGFRPSRSSAPKSVSTDRITTSATVVVHRGDTLWSLAARELGAAASDVEIAAAWPRWFAANRSVIGDDPHLLLPGQVLTVPRAPSGAP